MPRWHRQIELDIHSHSALACPTRRSLDMIDDEYYARTVLRFQFQPKLLLNRIEEGRPGKFQESELVLPTGGHWVFSKTRMCCNGSVSNVCMCASPTAFISLLTCSTDILCTNLMGTLGSSLRYSTKTTRPPGFRAPRILVMTSKGYASSW